MYYTAKTPLVKCIETSTGGHSHTPRVRNFYVGVNINTEPPKWGSAGPLGTGAWPILQSKLPF